MLQPQQIKQSVVASGLVAGRELEALRLRVYVGGKVGRAEADLLVVLRKRLQHHTPAFDEFYYRAVKDHILADGWIDGEAVSWLRRMVLADGKVDDQVLNLLRELRGEARVVSREFEKLFDECMKLPRGSIPADSQNGSALDGEVRDAGSDSGTG